MADRVREVKMPKPWPIEPGTVKLPTAEVERAQAAIWTRLFQSVEPTLVPEVARAILALDFPQGDKDRMHELAAKARAGALTAEEQEEIDTYGRVGSVLSIMKSKARRRLKGGLRSNGSDD